MAKKKTIFVCNNCGHETARWLGKCPSCQEWNTFFEEVVIEVPKGSATRGNIGKDAAKVTALKDISVEDLPRMATGYEEVDRVLGGGIVPGALVLLGGDPGIGKSTLLMQVAAHIASSTGAVLYASGEESQMQLKLRADRLEVEAKGLHIMADTNVDSIIAEGESGKYKLLIVDSIQTMYSPDFESAPGTVGQVRECTAKLLRFAKTSNVPVMIIGHVTKEGNIAGPRMLEHMVDVVLYFEGERSYQFRVLRAIKNRFGATSETGLFSMASEGLEELANPSEILLAERSEAEIGSAVMAYLEGQRPILAEVQSLVTTTAFGMPRRTAIGYDLNRLLLLLAVLEKQGRLQLGSKDVYVNVVGGLKMSETASDLTMAVAIASSYLDKPVSSDTIIMGEVGLTGNIRSIPRVEQRIQEALKMGFTRIIIPESNAKQLKKVSAKAKVVGVSTISECLQLVFRSK